MYMADFVEQVAPIIFIEKYDLAEFLDATLQSWMYLKTDPLVMIKGGYQWNKAGGNEVQILTHWLIVLCHCNH